MSNLRQDTLHVRDARFEFKPSEHKATLQIIYYIIWSIYIYVRGEVLVV